MSNRHFFSSVRPLSIAAIVFVISTMASGIVIWRSEVNRLQGYRSQIMVIAQDHSQAIESTLSSVMSVTYALAALVKQGNGTIHNFEHVAGEMLHLYPGLTELVLSPGGVVTQIAPLAGNEHILGFEQFKDPLQKKEALLARDTAKLTLAGPLNLKEGGVGMVGRFPVFLERKDADSKRYFWGFTNAIVRFPEALAPSRLSSLVEDGIAYELWRINPNTGQKQTIAKSTVSPIDPEHAIVALQNANWILSLSPVKGWDDPYMLSLKISLGVLLSFLLSYIVKLLLEAKYRALNLETLVDQRTAAIKAVLANEQRLRNALDQVPSPVYIKDTNSRYTYANKQALKLHNCSAEELVGSDASRFLKPDILKKLQATEKRVLAGESTDEEIEILDAHNIRHVHREMKTPIYADAERKIISGLCGISTDITASKEAEQRLRHFNRVYAVLSGINSLIVRVRDRDTLFREACRIAVEVGQFAAAYIAILDPDSNEPHLVASSNIDARNLETLLEILKKVANETIPEAEGIRDRILVKRQPLIVNDVEHGLPLSLREASDSAGVNSLCILPLVIANQAVGVLGLRARETDVFDAGELKLLVEMSSDIAFALDHLDRADKLNYLAYYDQLTGLANATLFHERLAQYVHTSSSKKQRVALVLLDVERFKTVNDALGRQAGNALLKQLAKRLADCAGDPEEVAHLGGDHFALVMPVVQGAEQVARIIEDRAHHCFADSFQIESTELNIVAKFGIALYPDDGYNAETLFRNAEAALKKAKNSGDRYLFYTQQMNDRVTERLTLENNLRHALEREEFVLHYQPKVESQTGHIAGVEALIRWNDPRTGLVPPNQFIPLLEETGLILDVGAWALRQATKDHNHWLEAGLAAPRIAVNVSAIQLRQKNFVEVVRQSLSLGPSPPGIDLEITESLIMEDIEGNIGKLNAIRDMGLSISIDDFGTGYSSMAYLVKLPVRELKIDRSFIITMLQEPNTMTLVSSIISLAHSLGLLVVAEGVDMEEQASKLRMLRCDKMQGYLYSKPIPLEEMTTLIGK
ncbi:putative Diguanylate cyclase [Georgfuchsia toluolica]|uniref:Diguanylate cyclase n=1 Tax=Georgfuchsia toluolica TaxID=424218 RepID=A0A916J6N4_9PROT|nr:EAL domain-containing protein [Georgfuchsia toluolica]CAG4883401.1 putative Diguanylate cyclase [Georgfuchsia toluolica]